MVNEKRIYILDAGALMRHKPSLDPNTLCLCTSGVVEEIRDKQSKEALENFAQFWQIGTPDRRAENITLAAARMTGDDNELSKVDLSVIALAVTSTLDHKISLRPKTELLAILNKETAPSVWNPTQESCDEERVSISVISGDRALRNVCFALGISALTLNYRPTQQLSSVSYKCRACQSSSSKKGGGCENCGSRQERIRVIY